MTTCRNYLITSMLLMCLHASSKEGNNIANSASTQFIANKGQVTDQYHGARPDIDAKIEAGGVTMFIGDGQLHYQWVAGQGQKSEGKTQKFGASEDTPLTPLKRGSVDPTSDIQDQPSNIEIYRMDVTLVGANKNAEVVFEEPTGYYENYYTAHTGENGVMAKGYKRVIYKDIYPGIDLIYYVDENSKGKSENQKLSGTSEHPALTLPERGNLKYDFIVYPGGNVADIRLRYDGATEMKMVDGALMATTPFGSITEQAPYCYVQEGGVAVTSAYKLRGNELSFDIGKYVGTLVIDPYLRWGTYFGGSLGDDADDITTSLDGYIYMAGRTQSTNNIATSGAYRTSLSGSAYTDAFVAKFDDSCHRLWATYYGGANQEEAHGIATDRLGNIYFCGITCSDTGIATTGAHQDIHGSYPLPPMQNVTDDGFLVKLNSAGQRQWSTYYGGQGIDHALGIACDRNNQVYICGNTTSATNISTLGSFMYFPIYGSTVPLYGTHGFLAKFNGAGQRLWGTYFADSNGQALYKVSCDTANNVFVGGNTFISSTTTNTLATSGVYQQGPVNSSNLSDGILAKFSPSGSLLWCSYYGGSNNDRIYNIACDDSGQVYATGYTYSTTNIASPNAYDTSRNGSCAFLVKFNGANGHRIWGTYYGGATTNATGIAISPGNRIYIGGSTSSDTVVATNNAYKTSRSGASDAFIAEFTAGGQLRYATYYGGVGNDGGVDGYSVISGGGGEVGLTCSREGVVYLASGTSSTSNISIGNVYQSTIGGNLDAYLVAFYTDTTVFVKQPFTDTVWCPGDTVHIVYGVNLPFVSGNSFTVQLSNASGSFASPVTIGSKTAVDKDTITCVIPLATTAGTGYRIRIVGSNPARTSEDNDWDIRIKANPASFSNSSNSPVCTTDTLRLNGSSTSTGITWAWTGPNSFTSSAEDTVIANTAMSHAGNYILTATLNSTGCSLKDTTTVTVNPTPAKPTAGSNSPVCETKTINLSTSTTTNGVSYAWTGPGYSSATQNPTVTNNAASTHAGDYISTVTINGCSNRDTVTVTVLPKPAKPTAAAPNSPLCAHQDLQLTATTINGANYTWYGPAGYYEYTQNPTRNYMQLNYAGAYYVFANLNGCISDTDSVVVVVNTDPNVSIYPTPGTTICDGQKAIFTAIPTNGGSVGYDWRVNGASKGVTTASYTTTGLKNGDEVTCLMVSIGTCATTFTDTSNAIKMVVQDLKTPSVTISADAGPSLFPNEPINFTADPKDAGSNPKYQWKRNGQSVGGATGKTWGANANFLTNGDNICVLITSDYACPNPDTALSNCIKLEIRLGVEDIVRDNNIRIYPNPTSGTITVTSSAIIEQITLTDLLGKQVLSQTGGGKKVQADMSGLAAGVYIIKVNGSVAGRVIKK
ncbi:MAG: T9SS type A sorting domain-containing protein [Chitinophagales bacterium]|nr:T9SS type A sorting domain-containing protein [Chitinophagales bacterium]